MILFLEKECKKCYITFLNLFFFFKKPFKKIFLIFKNKFIWWCLLKRWYYLDFFNILTLKRGVVSIKYRLRHFFWKKFNFYKNLDYFGIDILVHPKPLRKRSQYFCTAKMGKYHTVILQHVTLVLNDYSGGNLADALVKFFFKNSFAINLIQRTFWNFLFNSNYARWDSNFLWRSWNYNWSVLNRYSIWVMLGVNSSSNRSNINITDFSVFFGKRAKYLDKLSKLRKYNSSFRHTFWNSFYKLKFWNNKIFFILVYLITPYSIWRFFKNFFWVPFNLFTGRIDLYEYKTLNLKHRLDFFFEMNQKFHLVPTDKWPRWLFRNINRMEYTSNSNRKRVNRFKHAIKWFFFPKKINSIIHRVGWFPSKSRVGLSWRLRYYSRRGWLPSDNYDYFWVVLSNKPSSGFYFIDSYVTSSEGFQIVDFMYFFI